MIKIKPGSLFIEMNEFNSYSIEKCRKITSINLLNCTKKL